MKHRTLTSLILGLALATSAACGKKEEPKPAGADGASTPEPEGLQDKRKELEPAPGKAAPALPGPFATAGLYAVPKNATWVIVGSVKKVLDALGYEALYAKYGMLLAAFSEQVQQVTGKDFFKLSTWAEIGFDLDSPMGAFMPDLRSRAVVSFVALNDEAKALAFIDEIIKKTRAPLTPEKIGSATLYAMGEDNAAWLVSGKMFYSVMIQRGNGAAAMAKEILNVKEADSLAMSAELKAAVEGVNADEIGAFVQLKPVLEMLVARAENSPGNPDSPRSQRRHAAEAEMLKSLQAQLSTVAIGVDVTSGAAEATYKVALTDGGMLKTLLRNASDTQPILKATKDQPLIMLAGQLDPVAWQKWLESMMALEGDDPAEMHAEVKEALGFDIDKVFAALTGEAAWALTGDLQAVMKAEDPRKEFGGAAIFGLKDAEVIKAIVATLAATEPGKELAKWDAESATLTVTLPKVKQFQVVFKGNRVIASTDIGVAERLEGGESFVSGLGNAKLKALLERKDLAALGMLDESFIGLTFMMRSGKSMEPTLPADAAPEMKAKAEELAKLKAEIEPLRAKVEEARMKPLIDLFEKMGAMAGSLTVDANGVTATFGFYPNGATVTELIGQAVDAGMSMQKGGGEPTEDDKKLQELEDRRWKLESELWNANRREPTEMVPQPVPAPEPK